MFLLGGGGERERWEVGGVVVVLLLLEYAEVLCELRDTRHPLFVFGEGGEFGFYLREAFEVGDRLLDLALRVGVEVFGEGEYLGVDFFLLGGGYSV